MMKRPQWAGIRRAVCFSSQVRGGKNIAAAGRSGLGIGFEAGKNPNRLQGCRPMGDNGLVAGHGIMRI